jgi:hypothetical protein
MAYPSSNNWNIGNAIVSTNVAGLRTICRISL